MIYLVTGACGLVGANLTRHLLVSRPDCHVIALDRDTPGPDVDRFLGDDRDRLELVQADLTDPAALDGLRRVDVIVHGAAVTHVAAWEAATPRRYIDTNLVGTLNVLEWARTLPHLARFVYVGTGSVYGDGAEVPGDGPQPEDGPLAPHHLYSISKYASELLVRRYAELFAFDHRLVRLSGVFGPLERPTGSRSVMSPVCSLVHASLAGAPLRVTARTLESAADHISAEDVADGIARLADAPSAAHPAYNLAHGALTPFAALLEAAGHAGLPVELQVVERPEDAEIDLDPTRRRGRFNAYDITRARSDLGWQPRPLAEQLSTYAGWLRAGASS